MVIMLKLTVYALLLYTAATYRAQAATLHSTSDAAGHSEKAVRDGSVVPDRTIEQQPSDGKERADSLPADALVYQTSQESERLHTRARSQSQSADVAATRASASVAKSRKRKSGTRQGLNLGTATTDNKASLGQQQQQPLQQQQQRQHTQMRPLNGLTTGASDKSRQKARSAVNRGTGAGVDSRAGSGVHGRGQSLPRARTGSAGLRSNTADKGTVATVKPGFVASESIGLTALGPTMKGAAMEGAAAGHSRHNTYRGQGGGGGGSMMRGSGPADGATATAAGSMAAAAGTGASNPQGSDFIDATGSSRADQAVIFKGGMEASTTSITLTAATSTTGVNAATSAATAATAFTTTSASAASNMATVATNSATNDDATESSGALSLSQQRRAMLSSSASVTKMPHEHPRTALMASRLAFINAVEHWRSARRRRVARRLRSGAKAAHAAKLNTDGPITTSEVPRKERGRQAQAQRPDAS